MARKLKTDKALRDLVRLDAAREATGFALPEPSQQTFSDGEAFQQALRTQADSLALVDARNVKRIHLDGSLNDHASGLRLTKKAFMNFAKLSKAPAPFIMKLSGMDEQLALDVVQTLLDGPFLRGGPRFLVVDDESGLVLDVTSQDDYFPVYNAVIYDTALSALPDMKLTKGWIDGTQMRFTLTSTNSALEPRQGDPVRYGVDLQNDFGGGGSATVSDYLEVLRCTNGLVANDKERSVLVPHSNAEAEFIVQRIVMEASGRAATLAPVLDSAAKRILNGLEFDAVSGFILEDKRGGKKLLDRVVDYAVEEANKEDRDDEAVTLWNMVNGITYVAHDAKTMVKQVDLEALGYETLIRFDQLLAANATGAMTDSK